MRIPGLVLGYHGCDRDVADAMKRLERHFSKAENFLTAPSSQKSVTSSGVSAIQSEASSGISVQGTLKPRNPDHESSQCDDSLHHRLPIQKAHLRLNETVRRTHPGWPDGGQTRQPQRRGDKPPKGSAAPPGQHAKAGRKKRPIPGRTAYLGIKLSLILWHTLSQHESAS